MTFKEKVYAQLHKLTPGQLLDTHLIEKEELRERFIKTVKEFIDEGNYDYEFTNDYRYVKKLGFIAPCFFAWAEETKKGQIKNLSTVGYRSEKYQELYVNGKLIAIRNSK
jgi:hypothetical protein